MQARRNRKMTSGSRHFIGTGLREILFIIFCFAGLYLFISLASYNPLDPGWLYGSGDAQEVSNKGGLAGAMFADAFLYLFGYFAYFLVFIVVYAGWLIYQGRYADFLAEPKNLIVPGIGFMLTLSAGCGLAIVHFTAESAVLPSHAGGILGTLVGHSLESVFSPLGATLLLLALFFTGITLLTGLSWLKLMDLLGAHTLRLMPVAQRWLGRRAWPWLQARAAWLGQQGQAFSRWLGRQSLRAFRAARAQYQARRAARGASPEHMPDFSPAEETALAPAIAQPAESEPPLLQERVILDAPSAVEPVPQPDSVAAPPEPLPAAPPGALPSLACLAQAPVAPAKISERQALKDRFKKFLSKLSAKAEVKNIYVGPVVARVEIQPGSGLENTAQAHEFAEKLVTAAKLRGVRVVEATPALVSLEIPNPRRQPVLLGNLLNSPAFCDAASPLTLALGLDSSGQPVIVDLARMPHLLLAGGFADDIDRALHGLILSLLYKATPQEARLLLVDTGRASLLPYSSLPHLLTPLADKVAQATQSFRWCVAEMERRYRLMADLGVRNITGYNQKVRQAQPEDDLDPIPLNLSPIPYIIIVARELADLTQGESSEIEECITRLAQKARAAGIHMLLATQQPTVNVVSGLMRTNFPARIAFQVTGKSESRNLIGQAGAECLLGNGDMLYLTPGTGLPVRVHGPQVSPAEISSVLAELAKQDGPGFEDLSKNV